MHATFSQFSFFHSSIYGKELSVQVHELAKYFFAQEQDISSRISSGAGLIVFQLIQSSTLSLAIQSDSRGDGMPWCNSMHVFHICI